MILGAINECYNRTILIYTKGLFHYFEADVAWYDVTRFIKASFVDTISFKMGQVAIRGTYHFDIAKIIHSSE